MNKNIRIGLLACVLSISLSHTPAQGTYSADDLFKNTRYQAIAVTAFATWTALRANRFPLQLAGVGFAAYFGAIATKKEEQIINIVNECLKKIS